MAEIIDGKKIASEIEQNLAQKVRKYIAGGTTPCLAVILVGDDPASKVYVKNKQQACERVGIRAEQITLPANSFQEKVVDVIHELNNRKDVHGILLQLPLPEWFYPGAIIREIDPLKDVDCFHPYNEGLMYMDIPRFLPCTPAGIMRLLRESRTPIVGQRAVVVSRSNIVGKPTAMLLTNAGATTTICHSRTWDIEAECKQADILISAVGLPNFITADMVKPGATVIDVGINRDENGKLCGDVDFPAVESIAGKITPVPGGVGPMTIAMLMENTVKAMENLYDKERGIAYVI